MNNYFSNFIYSPIKDYFLYYQKFNFMRRLTKLISLILFIEVLLLTMSNSLTSYSQNFERFSNKEGFNQNTISCIEQDQYGFLWFGTPNGLIKYDGYEFKTYTTQSKTNGNISSNFITSLYNDNNGILWIGTNLGVNAYIPWLERFYTVPIPNTINVTHINSEMNDEIFFSGEHEIYICKLFDNENGTFKVSDNILNSQTNVSEIKDFSFKDNNTLILGTDNGIKKLSFELDSINFKVSVNSLSSFEELNNEQINVVSNIKNIFWIGTDKGLYKTTIDGTRVHVINNFSNIKGKNVPLGINAIYEDNSETVWIATIDNGLYKYDQEQEIFEHFKFDLKNKLTLSSQKINAVYQDDFNVLWIGTAQGGINKLDLAQKPFITYTNNPYDKYSISDNLVTSILEDSKGRLWVAGYNKGLFRSINLVNDKNINNLKFESFKNQIKLLDTNVIRCIYEDDKGYIWFGTDNTLIVYNPKNNQFKKVTFTSNSIQTIRNIHQIDKEHILLAGNLIFILKNPWEIIDKNKNPKLNIKSILPLNSNRVQAFLKDNKGFYWFGTSKGLLKCSFDGQNINIDKKFTDNKKDNISLSYNNIFSLHEDNNNLWVGTFGGGLNKLTLNDLGEPTKIDYYRKNDVLPDDAIYGILQEDDNYLWISTDMGLVRKYLNQNKIDVFDVRDGLAQNNFRQGAYFKGKSGYFYFGGLNGLTIFNPKNIELNTTPPKILITSLLVNNKVMKIGEKINNKIILEKSISETESISISQNEQTIAFQLAVKHTSTPTKNKLAYKLEGFNDDWIEKDEGKTTVTYTNLSAGDYIFKIKAANSDGVWSPEIKSLNVSILPPWHKTWWSYLIFFLLIVLIGIGIIIYFVQHEKLKQRLKYEQLDKERLDIINQGKFRYFTNISHEFRTPLTLIAGPLEHIMSTNKNSENSKYLAIIQKNTKRLISLVDQLITFRKAEQGYIHLNLSQNTLGNFIYPTTEAFENYAIEKNINFFYKVNSPNEKIVIDTEKVERILFNLLSNAFKNTPANGSISIESDIVLVSGKKMIQIDVVDNGKGIPAKDLDNIFERFYQLGTNEENVSGGGVGLAFCKSLINLFKGEISVKSKPFIETRFSVLIPAGNIEDYKSEEINTSEKSFIKEWVPLSVEYKSEILNSDTANDKEKQHHLLIVEDEEDVQNFLTSTLSKKYNITIANNGIEALEKIKLREPTLVISDVMMPEMDGFAFCEKIKSNPETCHIPVLLLTALSDNQDAIKGLEFGADEYVTKPFSLKLLELKIKKLIENNVRIKEYFTKNSSLPKKDIELSKRDKKFLNTVIEIIERNISDSNFGVEELSNEIGLSASHFYRRLKQLTGQIPNVYIRNFRLQRAAELLKENDGSNVAEIMYQIGIESNSYFSTSFKKLHGMSPSEFLKNNVANQA